MKRNASGDLFEDPDQAVPNLEDLEEILRSLGFRGVASVLCRGNFGVVSSLGRRSDLCLCRATTRQQERCFNSDHHLLRQHNYLSVYEPIPPICTIESGNSLLLQCVQVWLGKRRAMDDGTMEHYTLIR
jgi:hypothetical protein